MATKVFGAVNGNWSDDTKWVGAAKPTAADDVQLTVASANCTIDAAAVCRSLDCTGYVGVLTHAVSTALTIGDGTAGAGNIALKLVAGMTYTLGANTSSSLSFISTSATVQTIDLGGKQAGNTTFNAASNGSWQFTSAYNATAATITLTKGTLDTNGQTCTWGAFTSNSTSTRVLTLGASAITMTGSAASTWLLRFNGLTMTANTATVTMSGAGAGFDNNAIGGGNYDGMSLVQSGSGISFVGVSTGGTSITITLANYTRTGTASKLDGVIVGFPLTVTSALTLTGNSLINRVLVQTATLGTAKTIAVGSVSFTNVDFCDITITGSATPYGGTSIGDCLGNTGITFTAAVTRFGVVGGNWSATATWSATDGGSGGASVPLPQDTVKLTASSGAGPYSTDMPRVCKDIDCTGTTRQLQITSNGGTFNGNGNTFVIFGSLTLASGQTFSQTDTLVFAGRSANHTITMAGKAPSPSSSRHWIIMAVGGTYTLQDAFSITLATAGGFILLNGTFDANNQNLTFAGSSTAGMMRDAASTATRALLMGTGTWTFSGTGTVWSFISTGMTLTPSTSTIVLSDVSASTKTFTGGGLTYNALSITTGGSGSVTFAGSNTFASLATTGGSTKTIIFTISTTTTITGEGAVFFQGASGNLITITSSTAGTAFTVSKTSGKLVTNFLSLKDSTASGGASFFAGSGSTNVSGNTGWTFADPGYTPTGLANTISVGTPTVALTVTATPTGLDNAIALGTPTATLTVTVTPSGIANAIVLGTPTVALTITLVPTGVDGTIVLGAPTITQIVIVSPDGIANTIVLGSPTASLTITLTPDGINSVIVLGTPVVSGSVTAIPDGLDGLIVLGSPTMSSSVTLIPDGKDNSIVLGSPEITQTTLGQTVNPNGVSNPATLGSPSVSLTVNVTPTGVFTTAAGSVGMLGAVTIVPAGVSAAPALGTPAAGGTLVTVPGGIGSTAALGQPTVTVTYLAFPSGIDSTILLGGPLISMPWFAVPDGIASTLQLGRPHHNITLVFPVDAFLSTVSIGEVAISDVNRGEALLSDQPRALVSLGDQA